MLLESLLAILLFSIGILTVIALQAASVRHTSETRNRLEASYAANQIIGGMWGNRSNLASYNMAAVQTCTTADTNFAGSAMPLAARMPNLPNCRVQITVSSNDVTVRLLWRAPGETVDHVYLTRTSII